MVFHGYPDCNVIMPENPDTSDTVQYMSGCDDVDGLPRRNMSVTSLNNTNTNNDANKGSFKSRSTSSSNSNNNNNRQHSAQRVSSAGLKYYDIATQLLGKAGSDLEELFIAAARDGVYDRIETFIQRRSEIIISVDVKDKKTGNTPLIWAAKRGHAKIVHLLLRHGADVTLRNYEGQTAVEVASPSIRAILLDSVERSTEASHQLLLQAAWQGDIKVVKRLLTQNKVLDINCLNGEGFTPLMLATRDMHLFEKYAAQMTRPYNPVEVIDELISARADIHATDGDGKTCLHHASQSKAGLANSVVCTIVAHRPDMEFKDKRCFAAIHCACLTGNVDCISVLLDGGSEVNSRGYAGATPLHITSYNNHEKATTILLEHGANVTVTNDHGLTPLDLAKSRKMKAKLKEAWTEATSRRSTTNLAPIRAPSREDLRSSMEDLAKRKKGEVIFDGIPANPFTGGNRDTPAYSRGLTRHLSLKEKSRMEELLSRDPESGNPATPSPYLKDGVRRLGQVRNQKLSPMPRAKSRSIERLPAISPDRNMESPTFNRFSKSRRSLEDRSQGRGRRVAPLSTREGTLTADDIAERLTPAPSPTPSSKGNQPVRHKRSESDPNKSPNFADLASSCDPYLHSNKKGRSSSLSNNGADGLPESPRQTHVARQGMEREITMMSVCSMRSESRMSVASNSPRILNLSQMGVLSKSKTPSANSSVYPNSTKVLPPTPTFMTQHSGEGNSSKHGSPRSDDETLDYMALLQNPVELLRSRTMFKEEFILEETRPKDPFIQSSGSSNCDTVSSSSSSHLSSPRDTPTRARQQKTLSTNQKGRSCVVKGKGRSKTESSSSSESKNNHLGMNVCKQKLNQKLGSSQPKINNCVSQDSSVPQNIPTVLRNMAMKNAAAANNSSQNHSNPKPSSASIKGGGKIIIHGVLNEGQENKPDTNITSVKDETPSSTVQQGTTKDKSESSVQSTKVAASTVSKGDNSQGKTQGAKGKQCVRKPVRAGSGMGLHVVPTKLSSAVRNVPKPSATSSAAHKSEEKNTTEVSDTATKPDAEGQQSDEKNALVLNPYTASANVKRMLNSIKTSLDPAQQGTEKESETNSGSADKQCTPSTDVTTAKTQSGTSNKTVSQSGASNKTVTQSGPSNKTVTQSGPSNKTVTQSGPSNKTVTQSGTTNTAVTQSVTTNTTVNQSAASNTTVLAPSSEKTTSQTGTAAVKASSNSGSSKTTLSFSGTVTKSGNVNTTLTGGLRTASRTGSVNQNLNRNVNHSTSAQSGNRQGAQSRNNMTSSAGAVNRQTGAVKRSTYTPRFSTTQNTLRCSTAQKSVDNGKTVSSSVSRAESNNDSNVAKTSGASKSSSPSATAQREEEEEVVVNEIIASQSGDPLMTSGGAGATKFDVQSGVCRTTSMTRSYNMAPKNVSSVPTVSSNPNLTNTNGVTQPKSTRSLSTNTTNTVTGSGVTPTSSNETGSRHSAVSSSTNSAGKGKITSTSIVSRSTPHMPSVGETMVTRTDSGLARSASMSIIEEALEEQHTKADGRDLKVTPKRRPSSDGPAGMTSSADNANAIKPGIAPLIDILPDGAPRLQTNRYFDIVPEFHTPVIVNPFEELEQEREQQKGAVQQKLGARGVTATEFGFVVEKPNLERAKTTISLKSKSAKSAKKTGSKDATKNSRVSSGKVRQRKKSKDLKSEDASTRPRSGKGGKRQRSAKRKRKVPEPALGLQAEKSDVALISGIGWHVATACDDKTDVDAVVVRQCDSSESSEDEVDIVRVNSPTHFYPSGNLHLQIPGETTSSAQPSPRFMEVKSHREEKASLPTMINDGYPPMNLDMTQSSASKDRTYSSNSDHGRADLPGDISDLLTVYTSDNDLDEDDEDEDVYLGSVPEEMNHDILMSKLTPIPESPFTTHSSQTSLQHVARTVQAIKQFDVEVKEDDLNLLLGITPREGGSGHRNSAESQHSRMKSSKSGSVRSMETQHKSPKDRRREPETTPVQQISLNSKSAGSHNNSVRNSGNRRRGASKNDSDSDTGLKKSAGSRQTSGSVLCPSSSAPVMDESDEEVSVVEMYTDRISSTGSRDRVEPTPSSSASSAAAGGTAAKYDLKTLLTEKMQSTQKLLGESIHRIKSGSVDRVRRDKYHNDGNHGDDDDNVTVSQVPKLKIRGLEDEGITLNVDTSIRVNEDDLKTSTRSSRKERKFSETKMSADDDVDIDEAITDIMSNTFPRSRNSTLTSRQSDSYRSQSNTLTEKDQKVLLKMAEDSESSPFHAKQGSGTARESGSYDDSLTLNKDNPELMKRFHLSHMKMGQRVKAMIDAGADKSKVKAMLKVDNEAKQLAKIMNSFKQMELYAGPSSQNKSAKKETPRHVAESLQLDQSGTPRTASCTQKPPLARPGSAGAGKVRAGKFTEVKDVQVKPHNNHSHNNHSHGNHSQSNSSVVPKDLAAEFKKSPFVEFNPNDEDLQQYNEVFNGNSFEFERENSLERSDSSCTSLSSQSDMEETIQWKKGNVLGKGAFGTVWCGLTSEGQLIAVKQIELNTANQSKTRREYEKVQEEVELLKTLEHRNIVGYMGTSLEDSIVSIFMQFVPGGSIASILARFGALEETVFRRYTRQILEGVEYLHSNDVIHRDIKGGNVMLMPNGVIKLIDFGCAKRLCINLSMGQSQILKSMKGTPYWMSPEVVNETGHGKKSDIWSVGCTVFEMATRKPPWAEMNPMAAIFAIGADRPIPQLPDKFTEEALEFVNCCLTRDQNKRLSATELLQNTFIRRKFSKR